MLCGPGDRSDTVTSSRRFGLWNVMLTEASVIVAPASRESGDLHTVATVFGSRTAAAVQLDKRGTTARYDPKFDPVTLMLPMCCDVAIEGDGVL